MFLGSGLVWLRHLIHMATGFWTGDAKTSKEPDLTTIT